DRAAVDPSVAADHLEAGALDERLPLVLREPGEDEARLAAGAAHRQRQRPRARVPVGALPDAGLALEPAGVRVGDVLGARREDVEDEAAAGDEQRPRSPQPPQP